jgi:hypothetical protein
LLDEVEGEWRAAAEADVEAVGGLLELEVAAVLFVLGGRGFLLGHAEQLEGREQREVRLGLAEMDEVCDELVLWLGGGVVFVEGGEVEDVVEGGVDVIVVEDGRGRRPRRGFAGAS